MQAGDFLLTRANTPLSWLIRFGQAIKFGKQHRYSHWSHVALIVSPDGDLIEAHANGVRRAHIQDYEAKGIEFAHVPVKASYTDRRYILAFAESRLGETYGFLTFAAMVFNVLTPRRIYFGIDNTEICSTFVARALERAGYIFEHSTVAMVPADLAYHFSVGLT